jgi:16S rRNA (uracil1498-N3)-methyltransferase
VVVGGDCAERGVSLPTFVCTDPFVAGQIVTLGEDAAHHMRVLRIDPGQQVRLLDGQGGTGEGTLVRLAKRNASVQVDRAVTVEPPPAVHVLVPIADRDRMLWLAEKATELAATSWRPVNWKRSRSVSPRGEGPVFQQKIAARMAAALEQSNGAWRPTVYPDATLERAIAAAPDGVRFVLDGGGAPFARALSAALATSSAGGLPAITVAVGPEGGFEDGELALLGEAGFRAVSLGHTVLRFETAAEAGLAVVRAALDGLGHSRSSADDAAAWMDARANGDDGSPRAEGGSSDG